MGAAGHTRQVEALGWVGTVLEVRTVGKLQLLACVRGRKGQCGAGQAYSGVLKMQAGGELRQTYALDGHPRVSQQRDKGGNVTAAPVHARESLSTVQDDEDVARGSTFAARLCVR